MLFPNRSAKICRRQYGTSQANRRMTGRSPTSLPEHGKSAIAEGIDYEFGGRSYRTKGTRPSQLPIGRPE